MAFLAIDLETTGLDPHDGQILEVAWATAEHIEDIDIEKDIQSRVVWSHEARMSPYVAKMHAASGLLDDLLATDTDEIHIVEREILDGMDDFGKYILVGSSVHFDHAWIDVHMPTLAKMLHHRHVDATSNWMLDREAGIPDAEPPVIGTKHRAASDIATSVWHLQRAISQRRKSQTASRG